MRIVPGPQSFRTTPHPPQFAAVGEGGNVTADRRLGRIEELDKIADTHDRAFLDELQDQPVALPFQHFARSYKG